MYGPFKMVCWPILQTKKLPNTFEIDKIEKSYQLGKMYFYKKFLMRSALQNSNLVKAFYTIDINNPIVMTNPKK